MSEERGNLAVRNLARQPFRTLGPGRPPVLLCHGEDDEDVPLRLALAAGAWLRGEGYEVTHRHPALPPPFSPLSSSTF